MSLKNNKLDCFRDFRRNSNGGIQLAIVAYLREKIESGALPSGLLLPSLRKLAQLWGTNFFSVKLATDALQEAGLLTKHQGCGMFVASPLEKPARVGIYLSEVPYNRQNFIAFAVQCELLCERLDAAGIDYVIWRDTREAREHTTAPQAMQQAIAKKQVQAICGVNIRRYDMGWFCRLPIRKTYLTANRFFQPGFAAMAADLQQQGRERIAIISPEGQESRWSFIVEGFRDAGVRIPPRRLRIFNEQEYLQYDWSELGYRAAMELLTARRPPDALIVYPDNAVPGVIHAILQLGLKVPGDLTTIFHRNVELNYFCPFPSTYIDTSLSAMADQLFTSVVNAG